MKERAKVRLVDELVSKMGFRPLADQDGSIFRLEDGFILLKQSWGATFIVELIDGDQFAPYDIIIRMKHNFNAIKGIGGYYPVVFMEVLLFDDFISSDKLEAIRCINEQMQCDKRYFASFIVQAGRREVLKISDSPVGFDGVDDLLERFARSGYMSYDPAGMGEAYGNEFEDNVEIEPKLKLSEKKPAVSYALLMVNILVWSFTAYYGYANDVDANLLFGAKFNPLIMRGEYWRFLTPIFLHGGFVHLMFNSYFLYSVGPVVEKLFGRKKFASIYLTAGIMGNIASFIFSINPSVGASGALFGLMGALLYVGQKHRTLFKSSFGRNVIYTIVINIVFGFSQPGIDNFAHLGGLLGGYMSSCGVGLFWEKGINRARVLIWTAILVLAFSGIYAGFNMPANIELNRAYELYINSLR